MKRYILFAELSYAYPILRPLQAEIKRRGDEVAWLLAKGCPNLLTPSEKQLSTLDEAMAYNPIAVLAPGNYVPYMLPGVKVSIFHGYPLNKRNDKVDDHFKLRGWFDMYCTQGPSSTTRFKQLEQQKRYFKVYETGWAKMDAFFTQKQQEEQPKDKPTILYGTTFTKGITSAEVMAPIIRQLATKHNWRWILTMHPKLLTNRALTNLYKQLADELDNVEFRQQGTDAATLKECDVLLCDTSSLIIEFMMLDKPVVTFRNTLPDKHLINVEKLDEVEQAIETALTRPVALMEHIRKYTAWHEGHRDGKNSARILDAIDDFIANHKKNLRKKPLNLFRKLKQRWQTSYFKF